ncbi:MAG: hypothetical protein BGO98_46225 [Myxococcales bacterium 68-20]|nr:hypothetical protein [Myxococcales bacterium]OJY21040.1 MAG: hypothetical protein BGO98_46225 [Myxococcales bacterium 68-20]
MPSFARRPTALASLFASLSLLLVPACSSSDDGSSGKPSADAGSDTGVESDDVVVHFANRWGHADNAPVERASRYGTRTPTIVATVDGKETTFQPTVRDDGAFVFTGVPRAPYVLESRFQRTSAPAEDPIYLVRYSIDGGRNVEMGDDYWGRPDATVMTDDTKLALTVQAPQGIVEGDSFSWLGLHSYFYRAGTFVVDDESGGVQNPPTADATSSQDWTFDSTALAMPYGEDASGLPSATANDDLLILQDRTEGKNTPIDPADPMSRFEPWRLVSSNTVIGVLHAASPDFANGKTNTVTGTLEAPKTESFTIDFHGGTFDAVRLALGAPDETTNSSASISMSQEAGAGPAVYTSVAPTTWTLSTGARRKPVDLSCFPNPQSATCNPDVCTIGCENARKGFVHPGELSKFAYEGPRVYDTGMRDFYAVSYTYYTEVKLPDESSRFLSGGVSDSFPRTTSEPSFSLEVGPPSAITVDGKAIAWDSTIASIPDVHAPVVAFTPATKGAPEYHRVELIDLTPDLGKPLETARKYLTVALFITHDASVSIPKDQLRSGHTYYVRVTATKDGWKIGERAPRTSVYRTSIYSAPFVFGTAPAPANP